MRLTGDSGEVVVSRERLEREGYSFKHFTHQVKLKSGVLGNVQYDFAVFPEGEKFKVMYLYA